MAVRREDAIINEQLDLRIMFRYDDSGVLFDPYQIRQVEILDTDATTVLETITNITRLGVGEYQIITDSSWNTVSRLVYDKWYFTKSSGLSEDVALEDTFIKSLNISVEASINNLINDLRVLLKDTHPDYTKRRFTDNELRLYLEQALLDINVQPPAFTDFTLFDYEDNVPEWRGLITQGGMIFALISEGVFQIGLEFNYSDNGISINTDKSGKYQNMANMLLQNYQNYKKSIKQQYWFQSSKPRALLSVPIPMRIRSYAPRMWRVR